MISSKLTLFFSSQDWKYLKSDKKEVTYGRVVVAYNPDKLDKNRVCLAVGGDRIKYPFDISAPIADLATINLLWNLENVYLGLPFPQPELMRLPVNIIPEGVMQKYDLRKIAEDRYIYI